LDAVEFNVTPNNEDTSEIRNFEFE